MREREKIPFWVAKMVIIILLVGVACAISWRKLAEWFPASGVSADLENIEKIFGEFGQKVLYGVSGVVGGIAGVLALPVLVGGTIVGAVRFFRKYRSRSSR